MQKEALFFQPCTTCHLSFTLKKKSKSALMKNILLLINQHRDDYAFITRGFYLQSLTETKQLVLTSIITFHCFL